MPVSSTFSTSAPKSASSSEQKPPGEQAREVEHAHALQRQASGRCTGGAPAAAHDARAARGASCTVAGRRPTSSVICRALAISSPLERAISPVGQVQVVLQADPDRAAERERRGDQHPLLARDRRSRPSASGRRRDVVDHRGEVGAVGGMPPSDAHHAVDVQRRRAARPCRSAARGCRRGRGRSTRAPV